VRRSRSGFTVIEAVVSLAVTMVFMLIASQLVRDTQLASLATRRQALDPTPQHVAQSLRSDVHRSRGIDRLRGSRTTDWSSSNLSLLLPDGGIVRYEKSVDEIRRVIVAPDGSTALDRPLMRGVVGWRWIQLSSDLVEVEILFRRRPSNEALRRTWRAPEAVIEVTRMRLAMRAVPGKRSW